MAFMSRMVGAGSRVSSDEACNHRTPSGVGGRRPHAYPNLHSAVLAGVLGSDVLG